MYAHFYALVHNKLMTIIRFIITMCHSLIYKKVNFRNIMELFVSLIIDEKMIQDMVNKQIPFSSYPFLGFLYLQPNPVFCKV